MTECMLEVSTPGQSRGSGTGYPMEKRDVAGTRYSTDSMKGFAPAAEDQ